jgi:hypothetical protein
LNRHVTLAGQPRLGSTPNQLPTGYEIGLAANAGKRNASPRAEHEPDEVVEHRLVDRAGAEFERHTVEAVDVDTPS